MAKMNHIFGRKFKIFNHSVFVVSTNCCSQKRVKNKVRFFVYNSVSFSPTDKIWISLKPLWNFWSNELIRSPKFEKNYIRAQAFLTIFFLKRAPPNKGKLQKKDAICCQKCIILEQSKWSHAGCLNTANLATSQAELASEASFCLSFLINSWQHLYDKITLPDPSEMALAWKMHIVLAKFLVDQPLSENWSNYNFWNIACS